MYSLIKYGIIIKGTGKEKQEGGGVERKWGGREVSLMVTGCCPQPYFINLKVQVYLMEARHPSLHFGECLNNIKTLLMTTGLWFYPVLLL